MKINNSQVVTYFKAIEAHGDRLLAQGQPTDELLSRMDEAFSQAPLQKCFSLAEEPLEDGTTCFLYEPTQYSLDFLVENGISLTELPIGS